MSRLAGRLRSLLRTQLLLPQGFRRESWPAPRRESRRVVLQRPREGCSRSTLLFHQGCRLPPSHLTPQFSFFRQEMDLDISSSFHRSASLHRQNLGGRPACIARHCGCTIRLLPRNSPVTCLLLIRPRRTRRSFGRRVFLLPYNH